MANLSFIKEGGVAGHMNHLYDNPSLTFSNLKDILSQASQGKLVGTEKTDGQGIFLSYSVKDGKPKAARNKGNIKSGGLDASQLAAKFQGRGNIEQAFNDAFDTWAQAIQKLSPRRQVAIFGPDANIWYNAEIQTPSTANVINYDDNNLTIHQTGHAEYDKETGQITETDVSSAFSLLNKVIDGIEQRDDLKFKIVKSSVKKLRALSDPSFLDLTLSQLDAIIDNAGISDNQTIADFIAAKFDTALEQQIPDLSPEIKKQAIGRILGDKSVNLKNLIKSAGQDGPALAEFLQKSPDLKKDLMKPIEHLIHNFSVKMLEGIESAFILNNDAEVQRLRKEVSHAIDIIKNSNEPKAIQILNQQLEKLKDIENITTAMEGFVFQHDGQTYKFTGNFAPINQILGLFRYGRGDLPPMRDIVKEVENQQTIALIPGGFKPPSSEHWNLASSFANLNNVDRVLVLISPKSRSNEDGSVEINAKQSLAVWKIFSKDSPKITPKITSEASPVKAVFDYLLTLKPGTKVFLVAGDKDVDEPTNRYKNVNSFIEHNDLQIQVITSFVPQTASGKTVSSTLLRELIAKDKKQAYMKFQPKHLTKQDQNAVWEIVNQNRMQEELDEMSAMSAGAVEGAPNNMKKKKNPTIFREDMFIDRNTLLSELVARRDARRGALVVLEESLLNSWENLKQETRIRNIIRKIILKEAAADPEDTPHNSTGINVLEDLLKKIVPELETGYKSLTTKPEQRQSYRAHILNAIQKTLVREDITDDAGEETMRLAEQLIEYIDRNDILSMLGSMPEGGVNEADIDINVDEPATDGDLDKFIDIDKKASDPEAEEEDEFSIQGEDETGRNVARKSYEKIEKQIIDAYSVLSDPEDQKLFYDYLLTNIKLYFDKFESELDPSISEPVAGNEEADDLGLDKEPESELDLAL